jgi:hypothetical protein
MRLFTRHHLDRTDAVVAELLRPPPARERAVLLQYLGADYGYGLRDPATNRALPRDELTLAADHGAMVVELVDLVAPRDRARSDASAPGSRLRLVRRDGRVAVYDGERHHVVGFLDDRVAQQLDVALRRGAALRAVSLWESRALDGHRTDLWAVVVAPDVDLTVAVEPPRPVPAR